MIHVLFSSSAAGVLRQVLGTRGCPKSVIDLTESLDWGPIESGDFEERADWLDRNVPSSFAGGWDWIVEQVVKFEQTIAEDPDRLIWVEPTSAQELSGLYWYLERFGGSNAQMIVAPKYKSASGLGVRGLDSMAELLDSWPRAPWEPERFPANHWSALRAEGSLLRIVKEGVLQSASSDYFDHFLLAWCSSEWTTWMRVIGHAMIDIDDAGHSTDDLFLRWRLRELLRRGAIMSNQDLPLWGEHSQTLVRLTSREI
jgi:hypothetical protein